MEEGTSSRMADDDAPSVPATQQLEPEALRDEASSAAGTAGTLVTAMAESEARPEMPAELWASDEENISVPSRRTSLFDLRNKSETYSVAPNLGGTVLECPIAEDEADRNGFGEQDIATSGSHGAVFPTNEGVTDAAAKDTTGESSGEAKGSASGTTTEDTTAASTSGAEGNATAEGATAASRDGAEGHAAAQDTTAASRGEAEGNATAEDTTSERTGKAEVDAAVEDTTGENRGEAEVDAAVEDTAAASRGEVEGGDAAVDDTTPENRGEAEGNAAAEVIAAASRDKAESDAMAEGSVPNESIGPSVPGPEPADAHNAGNPPADNMADCRVDSTAAATSVASEGHPLSTAVDGTPGDHLPAPTANGESSDGATNSASELTGPSSRNEDNFEPAPSQPNRGPVFLQIKQKGARADQQTTRTSVDDESRPANKITLEAWATANSGEAQGRLKGRRGSVQVKPHRLVRRSSVFGGVKPLLGSHVGRVGTEHVTKPRRGSDQEMQQDSGAGSRKGPSRLASTVVRSRNSSYKLLDGLDGRAGSGDRVEMENQLEQGVYKNKRAALGDRKKDLFEQRLTLTNPSEDLEKLRDLLGSELDFEDEDDDFELINAKEIHGDSTISSRVINMTLNRSGKPFDQQIRESRVLTMENLPETFPVGRKAALTASIEGISLTQDMEKLLYLVGLYTNSVSPKEDEWIRLMPFMVLVYEATVDGLLGYGYAPTPVRFQGHRMYLNLSQEAFSDIDALRSLGLLKALKITSETYIHSTAFRVSPKGLAVLKARLVPQIKAAVQRFACMKVLSAQPGGKTKMELLKVQWDTEEESYYLVGEVSETFLRSTVTDVEALSYVMSPYLSRYLSTSDDCSGSLVDRVPELIAATQYDIQADDFLAVTMDSVRLLMTEWIPMGGNAIVSLNERLGSSERVQGGFFTAAVDKSPGATLFKGSRSGLTNVRLIDYETYSHVNFEAEVFYPSEPGVVQLESFSIHCNEQGDVMFGGLLEATTGCWKDAISSDCISRLLVDICFDSSRVLGNLTDSHQIDMLNCVMLSEPDKRGKFNVIMADGISPRIKAAAVLTRGQYANKIMQMVGDIRSAHDLGEHLVVIGRDSLLVCGPRSKEMEPTAILYAKCYARSIFLKAVFSRCFIVVDILNQAHVLLEDFVNYPEILENVRAVVASVSEDMLLLQEVQRAMLDSIQGLEEEQALDEEIHGPGFFKDELMEICGIKSQVKSLKRRAMDLEKTISACVHDMHTMQQMLSVVDEAKALKLGTGLRDNTKNLEELFRDDSRNSTSLEIINVVFAGSLAFQCMDRITGSYLGIAQDIEWIAVWVRPNITGIPGVWLAINLVAWAILAGIILWLMRRATYTANRIETSHQHVVARIHEPSLRAFLDSKNLKGQSSEVDGNTTVNKYGWQEDNGGMWGQVAPKFELEIDERHAFLLGFDTQVNKQAGSLPLHRAQLMLLLQLCIEGVINTGSVEESLGTFQESKASDNAGPADRLEFLETEYDRIHENGGVPDAYEAKLKELVDTVRMKLREDEVLQPDRSSKGTPSVAVHKSGKAGAKPGTSKSGINKPISSGMGGGSKALVRRLSTVMTNVLPAARKPQPKKKRRGTWASNVAASFRKNLSMRKSDGANASMDVDSSDMSLFQLRRMSEEQSRHR